MAFRHLSSPEFVSSPTMSATISSHISISQSIHSPHLPFFPSILRLRPSISIPNLHPTSSRFAIPSSRFRSSPFLARNHRFLSIKASSSESMKDDAYYMRRCVELARRAVGHTSPNPMVGCVIVKGGEIVGEGFHPKAGQPHAEVFALRDAGAHAENATAYVSLEPCNHYGRTPPCTEALISAKLKRVVVGMVDPNPIVALKGVERLRGAGMDVVVGVEEMMCRKLNEAYIHKMVTGKPFVTLRYSLSLNGRILNHLGKGAEESAGYYSQLLQEYDAVVISSNVVKTFGLPTSKETGANQPLHIVVITKDSGSLACLPQHAPMSGSKMVIFAEEAVPPIETEIEGIEAVVIGKLNWSSIVDYCGSRGLCSILLDLRRDDVDLAELLEDSLEELLLQKVVVEVCPVWDRSGETSILNFGRERLLLQFKDLESRISSDSIIVEGHMK